MDLSRSCFLCPGAGLQGHMVALFLVFKVTSILFSIVSVQFSTVTQSCPTLCKPMDCSKSGYSVHHWLLELAQTHIRRVGDAIQSSHPLPSPCPPALNLFQPQVFSNESALHIKWPKYWSFSFSISPSNEYSGMISFRMDCFDLLAVQGTLKSRLQHHSLKTSVLRCTK